MSHQQEHIFSAGHEQKLQLQDAHTDIHKHSTMHVQLMNINELHSDAGSIQLTSSRYQTTSEMQTVGPESGDKGAAAIACKEDYANKIVLMHASTTNSHGLVWPAIGILASNRLETKGMKIGIQENSRRIEG